MKFKLLVMFLAVALTTSFASAGGISCTADVNGDGVVDVNDLNLVIIFWGTDNAAADINQDGIVDVNDLVEVFVEWGCVEIDIPTTMIAGTVTNLWTGAPIEGATVTIGTTELTTDMMGEYTGDFPVGAYDVMFEATNFNGEEVPIILFPDIPLQLDEALEPVAAVVITINVSGDEEPGGTVMAMADVTVLDGSTITDYAWMQTGGVPATLSNDDTDTLTADLGATIDYKDELIDRLQTPPIDEDQLPPNVPLPPEPFPGGLPERFQVVGINPFALENAGAIELEVDVTTTSGTYPAHTEVHAGLPWDWTVGIRNTPLEVPVLLYGPEQMSYDWSLMAPGGSSAALFDATTEAPYFTPDIPGVYTVTVTDEDTMMPHTIEVFCGNFKGVIVGEDMDGRPVSDPACIGCHMSLGADKFTPWAQTGHAEIFTNNLNTSPYWGPQCFKCHTVGYLTDASNGGIDDQADFGAFLGSGLLFNPMPDNWTNMLAGYPDSARLANIQCENCHGPQDSFFGTATLAHGPANPMGEPRTDLSSDVCAYCHGEPLRHARFQQWQLSGHANYGLSDSYNQSGSCSRCHSVNGFLAWLPVLTGEVPGDPNDDVTVTWDADDSHPQTCVTCHDPHMIGTSSGIDNDATIRISGTTPPLIAGFTAYGVGRGAICMTCHNSRRGKRDDTTFDEHYQTSEASRGPHGSAQTDVLMGENAYQVLTGVRGAHSFLVDSCTSCHMKETDPPTDLAYNLGGTNHTFYAANDICANCHVGLDGPTLQEGVMATLDILQEAVEVGIFDVIDEQTTAGNAIDLNGDALITDSATIADIEFSEYHGRQAITVTFTDMMVLGPYTVNSVDVLDNSMMILGELYDFAPPAVVKGGWNWGLIHNDGSYGIHNPTYAYTAMSAAIAALDSLAAAEIEWPEWFDEKLRPVVQTELSTSSKRR